MIGQEFYKNFGEIKKIGNGLNPKVLQNNADLTSRGDVIIA